jgi:hypothetical protein
MGPRRWYRWADTDGRAAANAITVRKKTLLLALLIRCVQVWRLDGST